MPSEAHAKGIRLYQLGRYRQAADSFREELAATPDSAAGHRMLGLSLLMSNRSAAAYESVAEAIRPAPVEAQNHFAMAIVRTKHLKLDPRSGQKASDALRAMRKAGNHPLVDARNSIRRAIELDPTDPEFFALLASIEMAAGFWGNCLAAAERTLALRPDHRSGLVHRARALMVLGRSAEASTDMDLAIRVAPDDAAVHTARGWHMIKVGRPDAALQHFIEALRLNPNQKWVPAAAKQARLSLRFELYGWWYRFIVRAGRGEYRRLVFLICILPLLGVFMKPAEWIVRLCATAGLEGYAILSFGPLMDRRVWADPVERARIGAAGIAVARVAVWTGVLTLVVVLFALLCDEWADPVLQPTVPVCVAWAVLPWLPIAIIRSLAILLLGEDLHVRMRHQVDCGRRLP
jgi:tetratricopeptide (TPR) repeat protein